MSFPFLMVKLRRFRSISVHYEDEAGRTHEWTRLDLAISELLQHEIDHLDGVLAVDRALDSNSLVSRQVYEANRSEFDQQVDYAIVPTL
jgi:peptide deformylase